jgi:hypothetical protein
MSDEQPISNLVPPLPQGDIADSMQATEPAEVEEGIDESRLSPLERQARNQSRYQKKISALTSRNERLLQAVAESNRRYEQLQSRLDQIEKGFGSKLEESAKPKNPLDAYKNEELERARISMLRSEDPAEHQKAVDIDRELRRREREEILSEIKNMVGGERESRLREQEAARAVIETARLLGDEGANFVDFTTGTLKQSRETMMADAILNGLKKKYADSAERIPELRSYAMLLANQAVKAERAKAAQTDSRKTEGNLIRSRISDQVGAKGEAAPETVDRINAALKARDIDSALSHFDIVKKAEARRKSLLEKRSS